MSFVLRQDASTGQELRKQQVRETPRAFADFVISSW